MALNNNYNYMKMNLIRTNSSNLDSKGLCLQLDSELNARYGKTQSEYDQHKSI